MTWFDAIHELCLQVSYIKTIQDILETAVSECMITADQARFIADDCGVDSLTFEG